VKKNKIAIVSLPRAGSTYLLELAQFMQSYDVDYCEPFHMDRNPFEEHESDYSRFKKRLDEIKNGEKVLVKDVGNLHWYLNQNNTDFEKFRALDQEYRTFLNENFYTIYINRENFFDTILSYAIAVETNKWHRKRFDWFAEKVWIDPTAFEKHYEELQQQRKYVEQFCDFDKIVDYDTLTSNPKQDLKTVFDFDLKKTRKASTVRNHGKQQVVKNYHELETLYNTIGANNE